MVRTLFVIILTISLVYSQDPAVEGRLKADKLRALSDRFDGLIEFTPESFNHFILESPRPYTVVVLFTTSASKYKCTSCDEIQGMVHQVAYSYKVIGGENPSVSATGQKSRAVFFGKLEYSPQTHPIYQKFGFISVPNILVTQPKSILDEGDKLTVRKEDLWEFNMGTEVFTQKILDFINGRTFKSVEIKVSTFEAIASLIYSLALIGTLCSVGYFLRRLLLIPYVWFGGSLLVYFICMAGVVYDIIHGVPWVGSNDKGEPEFINSGQRSQYGLEGFLMSFIICIGGLALVLISAAAKLNNHWHVRGAGIFGIIVLLYSIYRIIQIYRVKASWYNPGMNPPSHYMKGPLINDQGNSF